MPGRERVEGLSYGRGGREQPFPCREDADGFAVAGEGVFLVVGDSQVAWRSCNTWSSRRRTKSHSLLPW